MEATVARFTKYQAIILAPVQVLAICVVAPAPVAHRGPIRFCCEFGREVISAVTVPETIFFFGFGLDVCCALSRQPTLAARMWSLEAWGKALFPSRHS